MNPCQKYENMTNSGKGQPVYCINYGKEYFFCALYITFQVLLCVFIRCFETLQPVSPETYGL